MLCVAFRGLVDLEIDHGKRQTELLGKRQQAGLDKRLTQLKAAGVCVHGIGNTLLKLRVCIVLFKKLYDIDIHVSFSINIVLV